MTKPIQNTLTDFEQVIAMITEARNRVYSKANAELVMLYFNIGKIVSEKVLAGNWVDRTVNNLADYIAKKQPVLKGFNRRGLYRMKQFYEGYSDPTIVSPLMTQFQSYNNEGDKFVSALLTQTNWTNHLLILAKTKTSEEKLFYLYQSIKEKLPTRELERQLNSATFERTMLGNKFSGVITSKLPAGIFKDPYITVCNLRFKRLNA